jgi:hypothetical protein
MQRLTMAGFSASARAALDHPPPNSNSIGLTLPSQDCLICPIGPCDIAVGWMQQRTPCTTVLCLKDITAVAERCLLHHCLITGDIFGNVM